MAVDIKSALKYANENPDSTFATELRRRIESGKMDKELIAAGVKQAPVSEPKDGVVETIKDVKSDAKEGFKAATDAVSKGFDTANEARQQVTDQKISPLAGTIKTIGGGLKAGATVVGEGIKTLGKFFISPKKEKELADSGKEAVGALINPEKVQKTLDSYEALSDEQKAYVDGIFGSAEGLATLFGAGGLAKASKEAALTAADTTIAAAKTAVKTAVNTTKAAVDAGAAGAESTIVPAVKAVTDKTGSFVNTVKDIAKNTVEGAAQIPNRIEVNLATKEAQRQAIEALPTEVAKQTARSGVDVPDVQTVVRMASAPPAQKTIARELVDSVKKFAAGDTSANPIEIVGKPIVARIKALEAGRAKVGAKLGEVADNLGAFTTNEIANPVFNALRKVPGLKGLEVGKKGNLIFDNTSLASSLSKSDRAAIQKAFTTAVKGGSGKQKHLFRQELFEILGGKKKSLTNMTDTQERSFEAIRQGLSTVLESKNPLYKKLSAQYRELITPLRDMRKVLKANDPNIDEDILDMKAGILARRLTSNAPSNADIRNILKAMDSAIGKKAASAIKVEDIQDLYNVLDKYYDISAKTGLKGQVKGAFEGASGFRDFISKTVGGLAGETPAVRQKALEQALAEALK